MFVIRGHNFNNDIHKVTIKHDDNIKKARIKIVKGLHPFKTAKKAITVKMLRGVLIIVGLF